MTRIIAISRPRFWLYVFGPYIVGLAAAVGSPADFLRLDSMVFALYFLLPANLLVYGINDIFDFESDSLNPKKSEYEMLVRPETHRALWTWIVILNLPFIITAVFLAPNALPSLVIFILLAVFYSSPPVRAKEVPFVDSLFNVLYVFPGAFGYQLITGELPSLSIIVAAGLWTAAMHAYSAIPDIESDTAACMETIATKLGPIGTHMFCIACYSVATLLCLTFALPLMLIGFAYVALMLFSIYSKNVFGFYRAFPVINAASGLVIFWYVAWPKFF